MFIPFFDFSSNKLNFQHFVIKSVSLDTSVFLQLNAVGSFFIVVTGPGGCCRPAAAKKDLNPNFVIPFYLFCECFTEMIGPSEDSCDAAGSLEGSQPSPKVFFKPSCKR